MPIDCHEVWREISNYLDDDVAADLRARMDEHLAACSHCAALLSSLRNVVRLYGDERLFPLPEGFSARVRERLLISIAAETSGASRQDLPQPPYPGAMTGRTWWATAIAAGLMFAALLVGRARDRQVPTLKGQHSQPAVRVPETMVVITDEGKTFHVPDCPYIHGRRRVVTAAEAVREGYVPCIRCEHELLSDPAPAS